MLSREVLEKVRRIEIQTRRLLTDALAGEYHSIFKGRGMEFAEVREYQMGDDIRTIDWNVTSRTGALHVKKFTEERELTVLLMLDASGSADFGTRSRFKRELAAEIGALLAFSAIRNNDRVGALVFTDDVEMYVPPRKGRSHVLRVIRDLLYFEPRGRGTNLARACEYLNRSHPEASRGLPPFRLPRCGLREAARRRVEEARPDLHLYLRSGRGGDSRRRAASSSRTRRAVGACSSIRPIERR